MINAKVSLFNSYAFMHYLNTQQIFIKLGTHVDWLKLGIRRKRHRRFLAKAQTLENVHMQNMYI